MEYRNKMQLKNPITSLRMSNLSGIGGFLQLSPFIRTIDSCSAKKEKVIGSLKHHLLNRYG
jgi:hypothetical protein